MAREKKWWETFFEDFRPAFRREPPGETLKQARAIFRKLEMKKGMRFLDCPCGFGRIGLPLARMGLKVTGVDLTRSYLDEFAASARRSGVRVELVHEDMRRITFDAQFHAAANLYTSFGCFPSDSQNVLVLRRIFRALRPGGRFLMSIINRDWILVNFTPSDWSEVGGVRILQTRRFDYARSVMHDTWHFLKDGTEKVHRTTLRLYSFHELRALFERVGFIDIEGCGSLDGRPTGRTNRDIFVLARKP